MTLKLSEDQKKIYQQPVLKFDDELEIEKVEINVQPTSK